MAESPPDSAGAYGREAHLLLPDQLSCVKVIRIRSRAARWHLVVPRRRAISGWTWLAEAPEARRAVRFPRSSRPRQVGLTRYRSRMPTVRIRLPRNPEERRPIHSPQR